MTLEEYITVKYERESMRKRGNGELLGYKMNTLKDIADRCDGIQPGFYIIGAYTNIGKTALLINIFRDLLDSNDDLSGIYFSLDDNKNVIINRLLARETGIPINQVQWQQNTIDDEKKVLTAYQKLQTLAREKRLAIYDLSEVTNIKQIEHEIRKEAAGKKLVVAIDGLYNIDLGEGKKYGGIREDTIELGNRVKALVDIHQIPIITTGEVRKKQAGGKEDQPPTLHDLMETGKLGYNANMVWILHPASMDDFKKAEEPVVNLHFEKNKLSEFRSSVALKFRKKICTLNLMTNSNLF
jgi:Replicative DNA helicase